MNVTKSSWAKYFLQTQEGSESKIFCVQLGTIARSK